MLVLKRKKGQRILIDGGIVITLISWDGGGARLGVDAPKAVKIMREEVLDKPKETVAA